MQTGIIIKLLVFLVEDDATIRTQLTSAMTGLLDASIVGTAPSEPEATRWLSHNQGAWNLAVIDLFIEEGTGFSVMSNMRYPSEQEHVLVLTNSATAENREHAFKCGAEAVFDKTEEIEEFFSYCEKLEILKVTQSPILKAT
jgi:two-component system OmpR family response regulator